MNRKTPKIMTKNRMYQPQSDTVKLFISIKEGGRGTPEDYRLCRN